MRRMPIHFGLCLALLSILAIDALAHPLGNFSVNQYSALRIGKGEIAIRYVVDMAEIPTFQEIQDAGLVPAVGAASASYLLQKVENLREGLTVEVNGKKVALLPTSREILFPAGAGGLPTMKIGATFKGEFDVAGAASYDMVYRDGNFPGRAGWKEIIAGAGDGTDVIESPVPTEDRSDQLSNYPADLLNSPPQILEARLSFRTSPAAAANKIDAAARPLVRQAIAGDRTNDAETMAPASSVDELPPEHKLSDASDEGPPDALRANRHSTRQDSFTELIAAKQFNSSMILFALLIAAALGAFHALEPGHGKTLVAAYLIGSRGTAKQALLLGLIVTASHTAAVYLLGGIVLYASEHVVPETLYPWLALASGVMIMVLGLVLLLRRLRVKDVAHHHHRHSPHDHDHRHHSGHGHPRDHHDADGHSHHHPTVSLHELLTLGISGGIVPCPAALVVLLSAVSLQRIGFGLLLIVAFSLGLAAVLIAIGLLMVYAGRAMGRFHGNGQLITRWLPLTSSAFIVLFGIGLTWQALASSGFLKL
jgi:nickel/cobalt exporter